MTRFFTTVAICLAFCGTATTVWGQYGYLEQSVPLITQAQAYPSITASGSSSVKCLPEIVQVIVALRAKGKTFEEALTSLEAEQKTALEKLQKLGVASERVRIHDFSVDRDQDAARKQLEMMLARQMRQAGQKTPVLPESVALKCMLFIEHPLTSKTAADILKEGYALAQKIKSADLSPKKPMTPEEEEIAEEMAGMMGFSSNSQDFDSEPRLVYVAHLPDEEYQKAFTEAFVQARQQGEVLAKGANAKLGVLMQLSGSTKKNVGSPLERFYSSNQDQYLMQLMMDQQFTFPLSKASSQNPNAIEFLINVNAVFMMEP